MPPIRRRSSQPLRTLVREHGALFAIVVITFFIYAVQEMLGEGWYGPLMAVPEKIGAAAKDLRAGHPDLDTWKTLSTLFTCTLLHADGSHIIYNMLFLWIFGAAVGELLGHRWVLMLFVLTGIAGSILQSYLSQGSPVPGLGASGAVMGFEGAYLGLAVRWRLPAPHVWPIAGPIPPERLALLAVVGVLLDLNGVLGPRDILAGGTAFGAHLGGFVCGMILTAVAAPKPRLAQLRH